MPTEPTLVDIVVRRHRTARINDQKAKNILEATTLILSGFDGTPDVECPIRFRLHGSVIPINDGDGSINSKAEYDQICAKSRTEDKRRYYIHVVQSVKWCRNKVRQNIWGCSDQPGNCMVVVRSMVEANLWAHEFGHNKGLRHKKNQGSAVMHPVIASYLRKVSDEECRALRKIGSSAFPKEHGLIPWGPIEDFVRRKYIHGVPFRDASTFTAEDVSRLFAMLADEGEQENWPAIVNVLAMTGDPRAFDALIARIEVEGGDDPDLEHETRDAALWSLGLLLNRREHPHALNLLVRYLRSDAALKGLTPRRGMSLTRADIQSQLAKSAAWGLGLSGSSDAGAALDQHVKSLAPEPGTAAERLTWVAEEALDAHTKVASDGLEAYYAG